MSPVLSAVLLDAADLGEGAHDKGEMHDADGGKKAIREATQAIRAASGDLDLESSPEENSPPSLNNAASNSLLRGELSPDATENQPDPCVTTSAHDSTPIQATAATENESSPVTPPSTAIVLPPRDTTPPATPHSTNTTAATNKHPPVAESSEHSHHTLSNVLSSLHHSHDGASDLKSVREGKMIFGHNAAGNSSHRRRILATTSALTDYEADLTGKDRAKQKEAVRQFLADTVQDDWKWEWPRVEDPAPTAEPAEDGPDDEQWKERDEWLSNASESGDEKALKTVKSAQQQDPRANKDSPFRFESPDGIGDAIKNGQNDRKRRRKKRLAEEMAWNDGVKCFVERRDAWTGARRVSKSPGVGMTPIQKEKTSGSLSSEDGGSSTAIEQEDDSEWEWDTEVPIAPPILPPENAMRSSITPAAYNTIYDKVILQSLTPSCPMNLKDVTRSCVQGWKRDGEWPPKATEIPKKKGRKMSIASLFSFEKHDENKDNEKHEVENKPTNEKSPKSPGGLGQSLRKILHLRKEKDYPTTNNGHMNGNNSKAAVA